MPWSLRGQKPYWLPWADTRWQPPEKPQEMSVELWSNMLQEIARFTPEAVITIGYRGEPALHGNIAVMLAQTMQYSGLQLYVETSGIGWSEEARKQLKQTECKAIIVELDAYKPEDYQKFRGIGMEEALSFIEEMRTVRKDLVYVQITRMQENEWDIQQFFKHWDAVSGVTPIIQKYNHFAAQLPDRKVADLTPLTRNPCWHLQRDMTVLYNGTVIRCYQDLNHEAVRGIVGEKPLEELWEAALEDYRLHVSENYPPLCKMCDEYYTFNA